MSESTEKLFALLPAIHRLRDAERNGPLRELLDIIAGQNDVLEEDLAQLYDDQFIETCAPWVVPYIGDLIAYRSLHHQVPAIGSPRAEVANTIVFRRRKGTAAMLEQLARDVGGWPGARVVEFFQLLATTQFMNHIRIENGLTPDLRRWGQLERLDTPFDTLAHSVDTRRIASGEGKHNIPNIGIFLWRLSAHRLRLSPACRLDAQRFLFSPLGNNAVLFTREVREKNITHLAELINVPNPISRRQLREALADYYGPGKSILVEGFALANVTVCNLSDSSGAWAHIPAPGKIAIDPVLGRLAFGDAQASLPLVTFHHGFSANMGGGEYEREQAFARPPQPVSAVAMPAKIQDAIAARTGGDAIQIEDSGRYEEALALAVQPGERFELRSGNEHRATIILRGEFVISGGDEHAEVALNGLLIAGGGIRVSGKLKTLRLSHCTLVPGLSLQNDGSPEHPQAPAIVIETSGVRLEIDHCITGALQLHPLARARITDSIVDATDSSGVAVAAPESLVAGALPATGVLPPAAGTLRLEESTVIGKIHVDQLELCSNSILVARTAVGDGWPASILVARRQTGCVRFSFLPEDARTPARYRCQPDLEIAAQIEAAAKAAHTTPHNLPAALRTALRREVVAWLAPAFVSLRYGEPAYGQLRTSVPRQIREGADDEAAMGAFHDLFEPQRATNVRVRIEEYLRFGLEAGVFYVT